MGELVKKLRIKEGHQVLVLNSPEGYTNLLLPLPDGAAMQSEPPQQQERQHQEQFKGLCPVVRSQHLKREETRASRLQKTVERLSSGLKNPWVKA
ncbi:hypothetical protein EDM54_22815 [Brevibacillus borstelensis]|uniref:YdeI/OmpD-associated family protein n=1 Tax=Brevibacillus borstelensis TaxID=45462 RepID=UPI000F09A321|nr:YdeI/OmpD-associated family protein [Brevibacillus borstelensis]MED1884823.1 YdeI/OmpD-associated family protein [Brevibacillus borstelensis]RNB57491.1 hypothetical protein EDM54_22815 [Brevibacillus borstelensis]GED55068.1 hypothetical protein BBO01nite_43090 [Brevibacillus borstelensis]